MGGAAASKCITHHSLDLPFIMGRLLLLLLFFIQDLDHLYQSLMEIQDLLKDDAEVWVKEGEIRVGEKWIETVGMGEKYLDFDIIFQES